MINTFSHTTSCLFLVIRTLHILIKYHINDTTCLGDYNNINLGLGGTFVYYCHWLLDINMSYGVYVYMEHT